MNYREKILACLGHFPEKVELGSTVDEQTDCGTHILQRVHYYVEPNERINAFLLLPPNLKAKNPAIIASHQHADEYYLGKSEPAGLSQNTMYHYGLDLCLRGYVALCPDHLGFEERRPPEYKRVENRNLEGGQYERLLFCKYIMNGSSLQAKYLSDLCRGVDFLESLPFVDAGKIGAIGHSLGGQETLWLTWYDTRIKVAVASCGFSQIRKIIRDGINHNFAMFTHGFLEHGDIGDLLCDLAPRPFMMTSGKSDAIFPLDGVYEIAEAARKAYAEKGMSNHFKSIVFEGGHSFPEEVKEQAYQWLDQFLK
jgi:dienelactone hydrolase